MKSACFLSVIIPAFNEAARLKKTLPVLREFLRQSDLTWEVVLADDGSEDFSEYHMWNVVFLPDGHKNKEEVLDMERKAFRKFYLRPRYILKKIIAIRSFEDIRRYWKGLILVLVGFVFKESEQSC